jgi:DNA-binding HxlR family transcriptional regulator
LPHQYSFTGAESFVSANLDESSRTVPDRILAKGLERAWLTSRREYAGIPPKTDHSLTALGPTLRPVLEAMADWGDRAQESLSGPA